MVKPGSRLALSKNQGVPRRPPAALPPAKSTEGGKCRDDNPGHPEGEEAGGVATQDPDEFAATFSATAGTLGPGKPLLSTLEMSVIDNLANAWDKFLQLESLHPDEVDEFRHAIHDAQHIIMARPVQRHFNTPD